LRHTNEEVFALKGELEALRDILPRVECPVSIIHGTEDGLVPFANVAYMERAFPEGTIREVIALEGANHFLPWNHAGDIRGAIARLGALQDNSIRSQGSDPSSPSNSGEALQTPGTSQISPDTSATTGR
jgi:hypothetical protein